MGHIQIYIKILSIFLPNAYYVKVVLNAWANTEFRSIDDLNKDINGKELEAGEK